MLNFLGKASKGKEKRWLVNFFLFSFMTTIEKKYIRKLFIEAGYIVMQVIFSSVEVGNLLQGTGLGP